ncbi:MAG: aryl-sulfate sulfotransferase, partial [Halobacteriales archaeon]|nr:aryl-sulfate sulfotransferase [Halobacteriales archaeon]
MRPSVAVVVGGILLVGLLAPVSAVPAASALADGNVCRGTITAPANGTTVISVQGARFQPNVTKEQARLVAVGPYGGIKWIHRSGKSEGIVWSYDIDPLPNGNLFVTATRPQRTVLYELDTETLEKRWEVVLPFVDTHDADMLDRHRIAIANMRNPDPENDTNNDRVVIYNRTSDTIEWEWRFAPRYPRSVGGNFSEDWTHVNDVDRIGDGRYLLSPRNFDQVIVVDRDTGTIDLKLGADDDFSILRKQHNPQYLESNDGAPTILVADSDNDRIVEYERDNDGWERTWELGGPEVFDWPRDADRLPNGNTLIADSRNHRVLEVTPDGKVVWELYTPWLVYDVERLPLGDEPGGPTIVDQEASGTYPLSAATPWPHERITRCGNYLDSVTPTTDRTPTLGPTTGRTTTQPATASPGQSGFGIALGVAVVLLVVLGLQRRY